jgi:hypothetical protein
MQQQLLLPEESPSWVDGLRVVQSPPTLRVCRSGSTRQHSKCNLIARCACLETMQLSLADELTGALALPHRKSQGKLRRPNVPSKSSKEPSGEFQEFTPKGSEAIDG